MTVKEMSDSMDSLLNSYATKAVFGEEASKEDIVLDEYEKSLYLTQAQDIVLKSYFQKNTNSEGNGFDDSEKRQIDFSSLITVKTLSQANGQHIPFDERGIIYAMPKRVNNGNEIEGTTDVLFVLNEKLITTTSVPAHWHYTGISAVGTSYPDQPGSADVPPSWYTVANPPEAHTYASVQDAEAAGWQFIEGKAGINKSYVVVPINYKEYDREMSKPYAQPLKKQAWRLFQNEGNGFDYLSELIPIWDLTTKETISEYRMRYIRRPNPIVLTDMPDGLSIEGFDKENTCELNPILHPEIVQKAVDIIVATRGLVRRPQQA